MKYFYSIVLIAQSFLGIHKENINPVKIIQNVTPTVEAAVLEPETLEEKISQLALKYNANKKLAALIIDCESHSSSTNTNLNTDNSIDWSYWQINDKWHLESAKKLGFDIHDPDQNLEFGFILLKEKGSPNKYWSASKKCWSRAQI